MLIFRQSHHQVSNISANFLKFMCHLFYLTPLPNNYQMPLLDSDILNIWQFFGKAVILHKGPVTARFPHRLLQCLTGGDSLGESFKQYKSFLILCVLRHFSILCGNNQSRVNSQHTTVALHHSFLCPSCAHFDYGYVVFLQIAF